jgi:hypothetical protein
MPIAPEPLRRAAAQPRVPYRVPCRVRLVDPLTGEVRTVVGETLEISRTGMSLQVSVNVATGTWVETLVLKPNGEPLFLAGSVAYCRRTLASNFELGVRATQPPTFV